jgi:hypothetical protein
MFPFDMPSFQPLISLKANSITVPVLCVLLVGLTSCQSFTIYIYDPYFIQNGPKASLPRNL